MQALADAVKEAEGKKGVGGWLLVLILFLGLLGPLPWLKTMWFYLIDVDWVLPQLLKDPYIALTWVTQAATAALSIYAAYGLFTDRNWTVVKRAQMALWICGPVAYFIVGLVLPAILLGEVDSPAVLARAIWPIVVAALWTAYLEKSERVRNTYARDEVETEE